MHSCKVGIGSGVICGVLVAPCVSPLELHPQVLRVALNLSLNLVLTHKIPFQLGGGINWLPINQQCGLSDCHMFSLQPTELSNCGRDLE